jgi:hypothetical protein
MPNEQYFNYIMVRISYNRWDYNDVHFVLDQDAELDLYSANSLKQQSRGTQVTSLGQIILIPSLPFSFMLRA